MPALRLKSSALVKFHCIVLKSVAGIHYAVKPGQKPHAFSHILLFCANRSKSDTVKRLTEARDTTSAPAVQGAPLYSLASLALTVRTLLMTLTSY